MNISEIRAEALKQAETCAGRDGKSGGHPRSIRKRGYHRALKRGEMWALLQKQSFDLINNLAAGLYSQPSESGGFFGYLDTDQMAKHAPLQMVYGLGAWLPKGDK